MEAPQVVNEQAPEPPLLEILLPQQMEVDQAMVPADPPQPQDQPDQEILGHNVNVNMDLFIMTQGDPGLNDFFGKLVRPTTPKPNLYRLWAKHFSLVGCLEQVVHIPSD